MRTPRIFTAQSLSAQLELELESAPSAHIARAMRMQPGDALTLFNGQGGEYAALISTVSKKIVTVEIGDFRNIELESPLAIHLGIAISRGDRMDWIIQKATELGVSRVSPLLTQRTEVKLKGDRADKKIQHWRQIAIAACEQCGRNQLPHIELLQDLPGWLAATKDETKLVLHHRALRAEPKNEEQKPTQVSLLIGPEGGLSDMEIGLAEQAQFQALRLGPRVMRTETAPLAAIAILQSQWGDMAST
ncbi:MAG: 16S rRNA (uracil1498-N3)-methyltransferase [Halioglobus sp.]|jgi:16S rRNA (uracil1498-N3)-methyltransferase